MVVKRGGQNGYYQKLIGAERAYRNRGAHRKGQVPNTWALHMWGELKRGVASRDGG